MALEILRLLMLAGLVCALSTLLVRVVRSANRRRLLDVPNERSSHVVPTPTGGGVGIVVAMLLGMAVLLPSVPDWQRVMLLVVTSGGLFLALVSFIDDVRRLPPGLRLAMHLCITVLVLQWGGYWERARIPGLGIVDLGWLGLPLTFAWFVGLMNAYNFMDGIDGIAGGQGVIAGIGWVVLGVLWHDIGTASIGAMLAGACLGFLFHNWSPARIFMGDVGSVFLGYMFAALPLLPRSSDPALQIAAIAMLWPFVFDSGMTFLRRLLSGENVFRPHRSHLYQRLVIAGYSHARVASIYVGLAVASAIASLGTVSDSEVVRVGGVAILVSAALGLWVFVRHIERARAVVVSESADLMTV